MMYRDWREVTKMLLNKKGCGAGNAAAREDEAAGDEAVRQVGDTGDQA